MLVENIATAIDLIDEVRKLESKSGELEEFKDFNRLLQNNRNQTIDKFINVYSILKKHDNKYFNLKTKSYVFNPINDLIKSLNKYEIPEKNKLFLLEEYISEFNNELKQKWENYIKEKTENIINSLENVKALHEDPTQISNITQKLRKLEEKWPINKQDLDDLNESIHLGKKIINLLDVDENVQEFLQKISRGDATLNDLDHNILNWLDKNNFKENLKISFNYVRRQNSLIDN